MDPDPVESGNFSLDPDLELFVLDPDTANMGEQINKIYNFRSVNSGLYSRTVV